MNKNRKKIGFADFLNPKDEVNTIPNRKFDNRKEKEVPENLPKIVFSFKDLDIIQNPPGQTYREWQDDKILDYMLTKFGAICTMTIPEALSQGVLKIYDSFPISSDFSHPPHIVADVKWAVIMNIKGQKGRIAGHLINNTFYVVFLDKNHLFYKMKKK